MMKKFGIAVVGCGRISTNHLRGIQEMSDQIRLVAVVDTIPERADARKQEYNAEKACYCLEDALKDPEIEGVDLCLPHYLHHPIAIRCMQAGKHVMVEKEMSTSYETSLDMVRMAKESGVTLMVGQSRRFFSAVQKSVELAHAGEIGHVFNVISVWQTKLDHALTTWWKSRAQAGGLLVALNGSHAVDYITWLKNYQYPKRVYCQLNHINPDWEGEDEVTMVLTYADGSTASVHLSFNQDDYRHFRIIEGTKGNMYLDDEKTLYVNREVREGNDKMPFSFGLQVMEFVSSIREGREPVCSGRIVAPVNAILDTAFLSAKTGQAIDLHERYPELANR